MANATQLPSPETSAVSTLDAGVPEPLVLTFRGGLPVGSVRYQPFRPEIAASKAITPPLSERATCRVCAKLGKTSWSPGALRS